MPSALQERIAAANKLDAKTKEEQSVLSGSKTVRGKKFKPTASSPPRPQPPTAAAAAPASASASPSASTADNRISIWSTDKSDPDPLADAARKRLANMKLGGAGGGGGGRAAALAKLGGGSGWQTTHHDSVSAHSKPFNKFAQATGARYEEQGEATTGSNMDTGRWKSG